MKKILILGGNSDIGIKVIDKLVNFNNFQLCVHFNKNFPRKKYAKKSKNHHIFTSPRSPQQRPNHPSSLIVG